MISFGRVLVFLLAGIVFILMFGPRESVDWTITFDETALGDDLVAYLAESEARIPAIRPGAEKEIIWAGAPGQTTDTALVYLHGFSATKREIAPVPQNVAARLGLNLYLSRLTGHGRTGGALGGARANDWLNDTVEAIAIGRRLGTRVVLIGTSTGGTLATLMAADPGFSRDVAGLVLVSPNYELAQSGAWLLTQPFARTFVPLVSGPTVSWTGENAEHGRWWTTEYPIQAVFPLAALTEQVRAVDAATIPIPAMFVYSEADTVVKAERTQQIAARWGGPVKTVVIEPGDGIDPSAHVLAGDILSPAMTEPISAAIVDWIKALE